MATLWQTLRYSSASLCQVPSSPPSPFSPLALNVGANTGHLHPDQRPPPHGHLPIRQPESLVELTVVRTEGKVPFSYPMFREVERNQRVFTGLVAWGAAGMMNVEVNQALFAQNHVVTATGNCYSELGVKLRSLDDC